MPTAHTRRPNILLIMADQLTPGALPVYGHKVTKAPNIEALAAGGVVFDAAYCNSPLCAPSRYVFMSGRLPSATGGYDNAAEFRSDIPTFAHHLRRAGYRTILSGKMHFCGPDQLHGFEERLTTDIYPADFGWTPDWERPEDRPSWYHNMSSVIEAGPCVRTNQLDFDDEVVFSARRKLFDMARGGDDRPFCMTVSMTHPHDPFAIPEQYWNLYRDEDIDLPRVTLSPEEMDPHSRRVRQVSDMDSATIGEREIRNARRAYYGAISYVDEQVGAIRRTLAETGLDRNTIVMVLADHGEMLGERGLWYKMTFFEGSARVPLIVHMPERFGAHRVSAAVSLADLLPTLVDFAHDGAAPAFEEPIDGRSLLPHLERRGGHDEAIGEYLAEGAVAPVVMIRRGRHKFVHCPADPDQLYDLAADPDELTNLAADPQADPAAADIVRDFREEVARRWDLQRLHGEVLSSQRRRRLIWDTARDGKQNPWDYQPFQDATRQYMRNTMDLDDLEAMARYPRVRPAVPPTG